MFLATALEAAPFTILGDVPLPAAAPWWAHYLMMAAPVVGWFVFSTVVAELNKMVRERDELAAIGATLPDGLKPITPSFRMVLSLLNRLAANHDKAAQQAAKAKGGES